MLHTRIVRKSTTNKDLYFAWLVPGFVLSTQKIQMGLQEPKSSKTLGWPPTIVWQLSKAAFQTRKLGTPCACPAMPHLRGPNCPETELYQKLSGKPEEHCRSDLERIVFLAKRGRTRSIRLRVGHGKITPDMHKMNQQRQVVLKADPARTRYVSFIFVITHICPASEWNTSRSTQHLSQKDTFNEITTMGGAQIPQTLTKNYTEKQRQPERSFERRFLEPPTSQKACEKHPKGVLARRKNLFSVQGHFFRSPLSKPTLLLLRRSSKLFQNRCKKNLCRFQGKP